MHFVTLWSTRCYISIRFAIIQLLMLRKIQLASLLFLFPILCLAQTMQVSGILIDTTAKKPLQHAVAMAIKISDSTLVNFTRTNTNGLFELKGLPVDTYQVLITHPQFSDQGFFIFGDTKNLVYNFGKITALPKSLNLDEITVFAYKDPIYYKGDTLIYTADSFKVKANANVEDLLKRLPGMKVDADGKITSQGKKVDKVLVDGDEFFGSDPTMATKNLAANSIESVQVYDKKSDDASSSSSGEETQKVLNLKLKEDAKKGYFGKISGASDFNKFYEGEALANYFKKQLKVSVFGLATNTPRTDFGWSDQFKYGLANDFEWNDDDEFNWQSNTPQGIPQNLKSGFYFSNKFNSKTKLTVNYTYNSSILKSSSTNNSQYFLTDTSYSTSNTTSSLKKNEAHAINLNLEQKIDSLTTINIKSSIKLLNDQTSTDNNTDFIAEDFTKIRNTDIINNSKNNGYDISNSIKLNRKFKKKDRLLNLNYSNAISKGDGDGVLKTDNYFYTASTLTLSAINQKKETQFNNVNHYAEVIFTEPFGKKIKLETSYDYTYYNGKQNKTSINSINGEYTVLDSNFTNNFINIKQINRIGLKFLYEIKKVRFTLGSKVRNVFVDNRNAFLNTQSYQHFNNILPFISFRYKKSDNAAYDASYKLQSTNPSLTQLQPLKDNTNQNFVSVGNPNLLPTQRHQLNISYNSWKPISSKYYWAGLNYNYTNNDFSNATSYDSLGRTLSKTINVNGNYNYGGNLGLSLPVISREVTIETTINANKSLQKSYINNLLNNTNRFNGSASLGLEVNLDSVVFGAKAEFDYTSTNSTLNTLSNKPFNSQNYSAHFSWKTPIKFLIETDATYTINSKRADGYNVNYFIWNASLSRTFLKNENIIVGFYAYDMFNQNINITRTITSNVISDLKTNIISRYFLLKATFKFNSNKTKETDDEM